MNKIYILECTYAIHGFNDIVVVMAKSAKEARLLIEKDHQQLYSMIHHTGSECCVKWSDHCFAFQEIEIAPDTSTILYGKIGKCI